MTRCMITSENFSPDGYAEAACGVQSSAAERPPHLEGRGAGGTVETDGPSRSALGVSALPSAAAGGVVVADRAETMTVGASIPGAATGVQPDLSSNDLAEIMSLFNCVTQQLHHAHEGLQAEVVRLQNELRQTNEQLRRSRELAALGQMAAGIAHEIRNPLGCIRLYAGMLRTDLERMPDSRSLAERIDRAALDMDAIVADVLAFAREVKVRRTPITAGELLTQALQGCAALLPRGGTGANGAGSGGAGAGMQIVADALECPLANTVLQVDPLLINQVLTNLMRNAMEAMEGRGRLELRLALSGRPHADASPTELGADASPNQAGFLAIGVLDSGPGIAPEVLERVFNPFFTTRPHGTGLGLAIAHRIADAHDAVIELRNRVEGGLQATLHLPLRTADGISSSAAGARGPAVAAPDASNAWKAPVEQAGGAQSAPVNGASSGPSASVGQAPGMNDPGAPAVSRSARTRRRPERTVDSAAPSPTGDRRSAPRRGNRLAQG